MANASKRAIHYDPMTSGEAWCGREIIKTMGTPLKEQVTCRDCKAALDRMAKA